MTRAVSGRCLVRNNNLNRGAVALPYRSRKVPLLSTTRDTSFPSFTAFATIPSAVDLRSRTWVYPAFSSFQINSCSAALTCEEPVVPWSVGGRVDGVVLGCASAGNVRARKQATVQAANRQLMMHSPVYARLPSMPGPGWLRTINPRSAGWFQLSAFLLLRQVSLSSKNSRRCAMKTRRLSGSKAPWSNAVPSESGTSMRRCGRWCCVRSIGRSHDVVREMHVAVRF
jgi:hypothetical protein